MIRVVNIKENMPPKDYAIFLLDSAIEDSKKMGDKALIVVHGYGSKGYGGEIKRAVVEYLTTAKKNGKITTFVKGDEWGEFNEDKKKICAVCPDLNINSQLNPINAGATAILL